MTLSENLTKELLEGLQGTKAFVITQAPDVIQQILQWKSAEAGFFVVVSLLLLGLGTWWWPKWTFDGDESDTPYMIGSVTALVIGVVMIFPNLYTMLQIHVAPKIFLIEYLTRLLKR